MREPTSISLCIIARDEERHLPRCLSSASGAVDEIVVVDTGSADRTVDIAESFGARVVHCPWTGDFAAARNVALEHATGTWVLVLDADDELSPAARDELRRLVSEASATVNGYAFTIASWLGKQPGGHVMTVVHPRLWRNRPQHRYNGAIHEWADIRPLAYTGLVIYHHGYLNNPPLRRQKAQRNAALLHEQLRQQPDDAYCLAQLAGEHMRLGRLPAAVTLLRRAWQLEKIHFLADRYAHCLARLRRFGAARQVLEEAIALWPDFTDLHFRYGSALLGLGEVSGARTALRHCVELGPPPPEYPALQGYSTFMAWLQLGHAEAALQNWRAAAEACWQALTIQPNYTPAVFLLVRSLVALAGPAGALRVVQEQTSLAPAAVPLVARSFAEWGCWSEALTVLEQAEAGASAAAAPVGLLRAQCLLVLGRPREALAELAGPLQGTASGSAAGEGSEEGLAARCVAAWTLGHPHLATAALDALAARRPSRTLADTLRRYHDHLYGGHSSPPRNMSECLRLLNLTEQLLLLDREDLANPATALLAEAADPLVVSGALGRLLVRYGRPETAEPYLRQALSAWGRRKRELPLVGGTRPDLLSDLGEVYLRTGNHAAAARSFRAVLALDPNRLTAYLGLAEACLAGATLLLSGPHRNACTTRMEEMRRERRRAQPLYDREGRSRQPEPCPP